MRNKSDPIRLIIADAEEIFRRDLRKLLTFQSGFDIVSEASDASIAATLAMRFQPDVLLLGFDLHGHNGMPGLLEMNGNLAAVPTVVLLPTAEREQLLQAFRLGARAIILKSSPSEVLRQGIRGVADGHYWFDNDCATILLDTLREFLPVSKNGARVLKDYGLTAQESNIIAKVAGGHTNKEISRECAISERTVKQHLTNIFTKVGVSSRLELALLAVKNGSPRNGEPAVARVSH